MRFSSRGKPRSLGSIIVLMIVGALAAHFYPQLNKERDRPGQTKAQPSVEQTTGAASKAGAPVERTATRVETPTIEGDGGIGKLFRERTSNVFVTTGGTIAKVLPDDNKTSDGSGRHQRFIVRLTTGDTVLIAHNIDLAARVPAHEGDVIRFRGEYEWTQQGGVIHWTHHDPAGRKQGGWIEFAGRQYK